MRSCTTSSARFVARPTLWVARLRSSRKGTMICRNDARAGFCARRNCGKHGREACGARRGSSLGGESDGATAQHLISSMAFFRTQEARVVSAPVALVTPFRPATASPRKVAASCREALRPLQKGERQRRGLAGFRDYTSLFFRGSPLRECPIRCRKHWTRIQYPGETY